MNSYAMPGKPIVKGALLGFLFVLMFALLVAHSRRAASAQDANPPAFVRQSNGSYVVQGQGYAARVDAHGLLASLKVSGAELLSEPVLYGDKDSFKLTPIAWRVVSATQSAPDTLEMQLAQPNAPADAKPEVSFTYHALPGALHMTLHRLIRPFGNSAFHLSDEVIGAEALARPGFGYKRVPGSGVLYAVPTIARYQTLRDLRYFFKNGHALDVYYLLAEAPFNRQSNGILLGDIWARPLVTGEPIEFIFEPVTNNGDQSLGRNAPPKQRPLRVGTERPIPYALNCLDGDGMTPTGQPTRFELAFAPKSVLNGPHTLDYRITDFWSREIAQGSLPVDPTDIRENKFAFSVHPKGKGWFNIVTALKPTNETGALPSENDSDFGVFTPKPELFSPPAPTDSVAGLTAALGLRCVRTPIVLTREFPTREKSPLEDPKYNWHDCDEFLNRMASDREKYHVTTFCLLNDRPTWADPETFEKLVNIIVSRYKDRNHNWEIENEPIGHNGYTPTTYVSTALAPAYRGAHAADPAAVVMGPAFVSVRLRWFEEFFKAGGGQYLDALSTHTYIGDNRSWEEEGNAELLHRLRVMMDANGLRAKPLWQTEQGFTWDNHAEAPRLQAAYLVRMFALAWSQGIPPERDDYFYTDAHGFEPWYIWDKAPNRAGMAARVFAEQTAGMHFDRETPMGKYAHCLRFTNGATDTVALWTDDFSATARFRITGESAPPVYDIMGDSVAIKPVREANETLFSLPLSGYPVYAHLTHGAKLEPLTRFADGKNWALDSNGGTASASSESKPPHDASALNDGTWNFDDGSNWLGIWVAAEHSPLPQWAQVMFSEPHRIHTVVAVTTSSNVALPGPRDYKLQVQTEDGWKTVSDVTGNTTRWVLYARFPPIVATGVRVVFNDLNNGWWWEDKSRYKDVDWRARVYELEAYGP